MIEPGIYRDYDPAKYFDDPCPEPSLTQSIAKILIDQSPWHAWTAHPRLGRAIVPADYDSRMAIGNAAHALMLHRSRDLAIIDADSFRAKDAQVRRDEAIKAGHIPVLQKHFETARTMVTVAREQLADHEACDAFLAGDGEVMIIAEVSDYWFRSLVDWLHNDLRCIEDYKTTGASVAEHGIAGKAEADGWHIQAAAQEWILDHVDPLNAGKRRFRFIAQENYPPYALTVVEMPEAWMQMGRKKWNAAMVLWAKCITSGKWHGYRPKIVLPEYPGWAEARWLARELDETLGPPARPNGFLGPDHLMAG